MVQYFDNFLADLEVVHETMDRGHVVNAILDHAIDRREVCSVPFKKVASRFFI